MNKSIFYNKYICTLIIAMSAFVSVKASETPQVEADTVIALSDISVTAIKQGVDLHKLPSSYTVLGRKKMEDYHILSVKDISEITPNFFVPDYGSRITSSIYVRGLGTRIDQPVVGLNIDNVPVMDKNNYDFDLPDLDRIEMLRGSQSTLFGRNTMGGLINIYTISPFTYQGIRGMAEYSSGNSYKMSASYYKKFSDKFAASITGAFNSSDGFFTNDYNGQKCDHEKQGSGRVKLQWRPSKNFTADNVFFFSVLKQGGYPYEYVETGKIAYNDTCFYKRNSFNDGLTLNWKVGKLTLSSITSLQYIDDNMTLDQDFLPLSYFTLSQQRKQFTFTEDLVAKGTVGKNYSWLVGAFGFYKHLDMDAPVEFKDYGIYKLIEENRNNAIPDYPIKWDSRNFVLASNFINPNYGLALYHQSTYKWNKFTFIGGLRLDYENTHLNYESSCTTGYSTIERNTGNVYFFTPVVINDPGRLNRDFLQLLPKISVMYNLDTPSPSNVFASISKGYKAGGFNTQMFSDVLQQKIMGVMGLSMSYDVDKIVGYKPEKSWTYELGAHIECSNSRISTDMSLFYIDCTDQQLTIFPDGNTTGRIMTNAGHTRSYGAEVAFRLRPIDNLEFNASYGYTNAKFVEFNNGKQDFSNKYVPYAPKNTLFVGASYRLPINTDWLRAVSFAANMSGAGDVYWSETNDLKQPFYALVGSNIRVDFEKFSLDLWGQNITDTAYKTFYFVSIGNSFLQRGKPRQLGVTLRFKL